LTLSVSSFSLAKTERAWRIFFIKWEKFHQRFFQILALQNDVEESDNCSESSGETDGDSEQQLAVPTCSITKDELTRVLTKKQLRQLCNEHDLGTEGTKDVLATRLVDSEK
jgi:hypothetical protein